MSDIQLYLLEVDKAPAEAQDVAAQSAAKLADKRLKLLDLITSLEPYINDKDNGTNRAKSISYLADVVERVSPKVLSGQERRLLSDFILGRLEGDVEGVGASARALVALEERGKWDSESAQKVAMTFLDSAGPLKNVRLQTERYAVTKLFDLLMAKYRGALKQLHDTDSHFMEKYIAFFDGEKDPRNLMIIFSILHVPMTEWDVHAHAQDLFEAVFNYFPITFKPPPDDPYGITAQDLKDRLRDCIAANSDFAPYAFPALLDKLDSTSMNTKRDVLQAVQACVTNYSPATVNLYSVTLWDALKFEILNVQEEDLAEQSLTALALIGGKFAGLDGPLNAYLRPIIKECNEHLEDAPTKQSQAAGRILHAVSASGLPVADRIAKGCLHVLLDLYRSSESITKRRGLLEVFNQVVKAYVELADTTPEVSVGALQGPGTDALEAMLRALQHAPKSEVSFRLTALTGLAQLISIPELLHDDYIHKAIDAVTEIILHERIEGHGDIQPEAINTLIGMAHSSPNAIRDRAIPTFMVELPDVPTDASNYRLVLEAFAQLTAEQQVFDTVVLRIKNKWTAARSNSASQEYQQTLLLALLYAFTHGSPMPNEDGVVRAGYFAEYAEPLIDALRSTDSGDGTKEIVGRIWNNILRPQSFHFQSSVYHRNLEWVTSAPGSGSASEESVHSMAPFTLFYYAALRPEIVEPADVTALLQKHATLVLSPTAHPTSIAVSLRHICLLVNKFIEPKSIESTLSHSNIEVASLLAADTRPQAVAIAFAIVKALLIQGRAAALATQYLQILQRLLPDPAQPNLPHLFASLLAPDDILTKQNHCRVSALYKQKAFHQLIPALTDAVRSTADPAAKTNYLVALAGLLRWLPYSMLQPSLPSLVPPLLQTLDLPTSPSHQDVKTATLALLESILMFDSPLLAEHAASLITRLLLCCTTATQTASSINAPAASPDQAAVKNSQPPSSVNPPRVRAKALQCLALVAKQLKRETVVPFRRQVVKKLLPCLDDPRRTVRAEAVKCRGAWLAVDDDEEDEE